MGRGWTQGPLQVLIKKTYRSTSRPTARLSSISPLSSSSSSSLISLSFGPSAVYYVGLYGWMYKARIRANSFRLPLLLTAGIFSSALAAQMSGIVTSIKQQKPQEHTHTHREQDGRIDNRPFLISPSHLNASPPPPPLREMDNNNTERPDRNYNNSKT